MVIAPLFAAALSVVAAPGPRGMTVRWFPHAPNTPLAATVVRIDSNGKREAPVTVQRPASASQASASGVRVLPGAMRDVNAFNAEVDKRGAGFFANAGGVDIALVRGTAYIDRGAVGGQRYQYQVVLSDGESGLSPISPPAGAKPPLRDYHVTMLAAREGDRRVNLTMQSVTHHGNFNVYRSSGAGFERIAQILGNENGTAYADMGAPLHRRLAYRVTVVDAFDNEGPPSEIAYAMARDLHQGPPPRNLRVRAMGNALMLTWLPSLDATIAGYDVLRAAPRKPYARIAQLSAQARQYVDHVPLGVTYTYDVRARSVDGAEGYTSGGVANFAPKLTPPDAPGGLAARALANGVALSWNASRDATTQEYEIYRRAPGARAILLRFVPATVRAYTDRVPADARARYEYGIGAADRFGNRVLPGRWLPARPLRSSITQAAPPIAVEYANRAVTISMVPIIDEDVAIQRVLRGEDGHALHAVASLPPSQTRYVDRGVASGHRYAYALAAVDRGGVQGRTSKSLSLNIPVAPAAAPAPLARVLSDRRTVELHWPHASGLLGYQLVRRNPDGTRVVIEPLLRAFAYRDPLPKRARGRFAYALREITPAGSGSLGNFTSVDVH